MPGHWKHGWIPLDAPAAKSKNHGTPDPDFSSKMDGMVRGAVATKSRKHYDGDTPVPDDVANILDKRVQLMGQETLTPAENRRLLSAVVTHGKKAPTLYRGMSLDVKPADFQPGQPIDFSAVSTSEDEGAALPYSENGDHKPVLFVFEGASGLNVQNRAEATAGYAEAEWVTGGRMYVHRTETDPDGTLVVQVGPMPRQDSASSRNAVKKKPRKL